MVPKTLTQVGNPIIRTQTRTVKNPTSREIQQLIATMTRALRKFNLVGIAANQIGVNAQVFLTEIRRTEIRKQATGDQLRVFINPKLTWQSKKQTELIEGCGSLAHARLFGPVKRPEKVTVEALDKNGNPFQLTATGLLAKVIQHEYEHLQGINIIDKFIDTRRVTAREEL